jgi:GTP-binding protein LepA
MESKNIRNFAIIAHIDHGKSTLADRIMEICGAVGTDHQSQLLDSLELEREHGITIKLKAIRLNYSVDSSQYILNLIDTPGHVDFGYEVSRSLASVEGAVLVVDATQGIQAQTLANFNLSLEANLAIIPVVNKIDSPAANVTETVEELKLLGFTEGEILKVSAKTGEGVENLIKEITSRIPAPTARGENPQALIFDSSLDPYKGVIATVRMFGGKIKAGDQIKFIATSAVADVLQIGYLSPKPIYIDEIKNGEVGFIVTNSKDLSKIKVGDTVTLPQNSSPPLPGYKEANPVVFLSFYPTDPHDLPKLKNGLEKLKLNDAALTFTPESSLSLGQGFRLGFLGLLHSQITQERLEREHDLDIIVTSPSVNFEQNGEVINKPSDFDPTAKDIKEPYAKVTIFTPQKYYGVISQLIYEKRGVQEGLENIGASQKIEAKIPFIEILIGFYDQLKTQTSGYASFDFEITEYRPAKLVKLDILVNHEPVEGLAQIIPQEHAEEFGRKFVEKLKEAIPRQNIPVPIQAAIGGKIIARETVAAYRKDVTAKLYGGDVTRKNKLLEKQKKGKKRMRRFGSVDIPQEAFLAVLKL